MDLTLVDFTNARAKEQELILQWRNDLRINKWMLKRKQISKKEHTSFIQKLKGDNFNKYWLVKDRTNGNYLGVIYLNSISNKDKIAELGLYTNPDLIGKGFGTILLDELKRIARYKYQLKKLTLDVLTSNIRAINLYKKNGFINDKSIEEKIEMNRKNYEIVHMCYNFNLKKI